MSDYGTQPLIDLMNCPDMDTVINEIIKRDNIDVSEYDVIKWALSKEISKTLNEPYGEEWLRVYEDGIDEKIQEEKIKIFLSKTPLLKNNPTN